MKIKNKDGRNFDLPVEKRCLVKPFLTGVCNFIKKGYYFFGQQKFLFGGMLSVGILPTVTFTRRIWKEPASNYSPVNFTETPASETTSLFNLWEIASWIYFLVSFFLLVRLGLKLFSVAKLIWAHTVEKKEDLL